MALHNALTWDEALLRDLAELGVSRVEGKLYLAALGQPAMRAAEIAELAGVSRTKAYAALRQLVEKGLFSVERTGQVTHFKAVDPGRAVLQLRARTIRDQTGLVEDTRLLVADLFERYYAAPRSEDPFDFVELLRNSEAVTARCEAITASAHAEVVRARQLPPPGLRPSLNGEPPVRSGVRYRTLYESGYLEYPEVRALIAMRQGQGEEARFVERVPLSLLVVDRRSSVISLNSTGVLSGPGLWLVLEEPGLAGLLTDAFEEAWERAAPADHPKVV